MAAMSIQPLATPQLAETLFYQAFENADLDGMMQVWDHSQDIVCIHPMSLRLVGLSAIEKSWIDIFQYSPKVKININTQNTMQNDDLSVHVLHEVFHVEGEAVPQAPVIATNVYRLTDNGWRMILHHASSLPKPQPRSAEPTVLH